MSDAIDTLTAEIHEILGDDHRHAVTAHGDTVVALRYLEPISGRVRERLRDAAGNHGVQIAFADRTRFVIPTE